MNIICFGQQNWDYCWTGKQQLMTRLARRGHRVLYVDPQSVEDVAGGSEAWRALAPAHTGFGVREVQERLFLFTHRHAPALRWRVNQWRRPRVIGAVARRLGFDDAVALVHHPLAGVHVGAVRPAALVYYAVDEATGFGGMSEDEQTRVREAEEALVRRADVVLGISPRLHDRLALLHPRSYLLESAADLDHFSPERLARAPALPSVAGLPRPRLGFVGQVDERTDQPLLVSLARAHPEWTIVLAGRVKPGVDVSALDAEPSIHLLGYQSYDALPGVLRDIDVCLVPYHLTPLTHACSPLKVYEYLATGRPVVSTPLDALLRTAGVVRLAATPDAFRAAIEHALAAPDEGRAERLAFAAANGWDERVLELEQRLAEALELGRRGRPRALRRPARAPATTDARADDERLSAKGRAAAAALDIAGRAYHAARVLGRVARGQRPARVRRILVARRSRLGDLVVFLPTLRALRARYPHARIVLGVHPGFQAGVLLRELRDVDEIRVLDHFAAPTARERLGGTLRLFAEGFDLVVSGSRHFIMREALLCGAPLRVGLDDGHPLQALNTHVLPLDPTRHEADDNLALVEALGAQVEPRDRVPRVEVEAREAGRRADRLLQAFGIPPEAPLVLVHPGAQKPAHRWPAEHYAALMEALLRDHRDLNIVLSGTSEEQALCERIHGALPAPLRRRAFDGAGVIDLVTLSGLLDRAAAFVCNDTGVMHLARARGAPLVAVLGPENELRWGPYPLGTAPAISLRNEVPCAPCSRWDCAALFCLRSLPPAAVAGAVRELLAEARGDARRAARERRAGAVDLVPLERRTRRLSWEALAARGLDVPLVTVVVEPLADAARDAVDRTLRSLAAQSHPRVEAVVALAPGAPEALPPSVGAVRVHRVHAASGEDAWRAALAAACGTLFLAAPAGAEWGRDHIADRLSVWMRDAQSDAEPRDDARLAAHERIVERPRARRGPLPDERPRATAAVPPASPAAMPSAVTIGHGRRRA